LLSVACGLDQSGSRTACGLNVAGEQEKCSLGVVKRCYRLLTLKKFAVRQSMEPAAAGSGNEFEQG
jgi:hypothetical protein